MVTPATAGAVARHAPTPGNRSLDAPLDAIAAELRALYAESFRLALRAAEDARTRFETPDGTEPLDPVYAADTAACRAVNGHLPAVVARWLPGAQLVDGNDEPAVIESRWLHQRRVIDIEWSYSFDFGDAEALTVVQR